MAFSSAFYGEDVLFYTGTQASSSLVPGQYHVALNGHAYLIDNLLDQTGLRSQYMRRETIPLLRDQADTGNEPDEGSINPADLWRRTQESWWHGSAQVHFDRRASDSERFHTSKGVDCWTPWQLTLLADTSQSLSSANTMRLAVAGTYLYVTDGTALKYSTGGAYTTVTGTPNAATGICSDGYDIFTAHGASGIYSTTRGAATSTSYNTTQADIVGYANGRLMAGKANKLYNITGTATQTDLTPPTLSTDWTWTGFADGPVSLYACGYSGDKSLIWQSAINSAGTTLNPPTVALTLPTGETAQSMTSYLNFVIIGTSLGVRVAEIQGDGSLKMFDLIPTSSSVLAVTAYGRFVYYALTNYDGTSTGIGRADLSTFTNSGFTPAYASDLMVTGQGTVAGLAMWNAQPVIGVNGLGIYVPSANKVASGTISQGLIAYGLTDKKVAMYTDLRCLPLPAGASITVSLATDGGTATTLANLTGTGVTGPSPQIPCNQAVGETFELTWTLFRATDTTTGPTLKRVMLRSYPVPNRGSVWTLPLLLNESDLVMANDQTVSRSVAAEKAFLFGLPSTPGTVLLQVLNESHTGFVETVTEIQYAPTQNRDTYGSTIVVTFKEPSQ